MDQIINSKKEKQTIYEIFRACRLCGAGGGYKMPIMQSVLNLDDNEVELKQKIRECVQIEVNHDDKMPPLICELCVDKINDFYEFLEMCRATNKQTRLRLGLPPQAPIHGAPDSDDCILGVTEPIYTNDSNSSGQQGKKKAMAKGGIRVKKEFELRVKVEPMDMDRARKVHNKSKGTTSKQLRSLSSTRSSRSGTKDDTPLSKLKGSSRSSRGILKKEVKMLIEASPRPKRRRDSDSKPEIPNKRVKIQPKISTRSRPEPRPAPRPVRPAPRPAPKRAPSPAPAFPCRICAVRFKTTAAVSNHVRVHQVLYTKPDCACNACGLWFKSSEEAALHHRRHGTYRCKHCNSRYPNYDKYLKHFANKPCEPFVGEPDVKCELCWRTFPTEPLLDSHKCLGEDGRPGGKCSKCKRTYSLLKNLKKHESLCSVRRKAEFKVSPELMAKVKPIQVRVARCDPLLANTVEDHYDVANVSHEYGLDENCVYPYISPTSRRIKSEPYLSAYDTMVNITDDSLDLDYVHWDSESESEEEDNASQTKEIPTLTKLSLKTIFSHRFLGKVPRKRRKLKAELEKEILFDSTMNNTDIDFAKGINDIIDNLVDDNDETPNDTTNVSTTDKTLNQSADDELFPTNDTNEKAVTNDDFDSLFGTSKANVNDTKNSIIRPVNDDENDTKDKDCNDQNDSMANKAASKNNDVSSNDKPNDRNESIDKIDKCDNDKANGEGSCNKPLEDKENDAKVNDETNVADTTDGPNEISDKIEKDTTAVSDIMNYNESSNQNKQKDVESTTIDDKNINIHTKSDGDKCLSDLKQESNKSSVLKIDSVITSDTQISNERELNMMEEEKDKSAANITDNDKLETVESKDDTPNDSNEKMDISDSFNKPEIIKEGEKLNSVKSVHEEAMDVDSSTLDNGDSKKEKDNSTLETKIGAQQTVDEKLGLSEAHKTTQIKELEISENEQIESKVAEGHSNIELNEEKSSEEITKETERNKENYSKIEQSNVTKDENEKELQNFKTNLNGQIEKEKLKAISDLEDKILLDAIDAQLDGSEKNIQKDNTDKISLEDLGQSKDTSMDLDSISDTEFDYDT